MSEQQGWPIKTARFAWGIAGDIGGLISRIFKHDSRPICPECHRRVNVEDEIFFHRGMSFHGSCIGYKRPGSPPTSDGSRTKR